MADRIEEQLKKLNRKQDTIITLLETLVVLAGGHLQEQVDTRTSEQIREDAQGRASVVPRGPMRGKYTETEKQSIHPHEREGY
jgi:hypothetical protein